MLVPLLPRSNGRCGRWRDHRQVTNGIIHRLSTGCQCRKLPERFGPWQTIHKRHALWSADGTWQRLLQHVQAVADPAGDIDWNINIDSTSIRAHQHAAGAPMGPPPAAPSASKGAAQRSLHVRAPLRLRPFLAEAVRQAKRSAARGAMKLAFLAALEQRTAPRYTMPGMTSAETTSYVAHHLKIAGRPDQLFTEDTPSR